MCEMGQLRLLACESKEKAENIRGELLFLTSAVRCEDCFIIVVAPYGPDVFPMDFLEKGFNVIAKTFQATDPRKGCIGVMIAWKEIKHVKNKG